MTTHRTPQRRLGFLTGTIAALGVAGFLTMKEAWYQFSFHAPVLTLPTLQSYSDASASTLLTGWELTQPGTATGVSGTAMGNIGSIPTPLFLLCAASLCAVGAWRVRSTLLAGGGVIAAWFAHRIVQTTGALIENPQSGGQYMTRLAAFDRFDLFTLVTMALCGVLAAQIMVVKRDERTALKEAGEQVQPTLAEILTEVHIGNVIRGIGQMARNTEDSSTRR